MGCEIYGFAQPLCRTHGDTVLLRCSRDGDEALRAELQAAKLQLGAARKFYDWYMNAGSWSDVGLDASSGTRWVLSVKEALEGDRLTEELDRVTGWDKPITEKRKCDSTGPCEDGHVCDLRKDLDV